MTAHDADDNGNDGGGGEEGVSVSTTSNLENGEGSGRPIVEIKALNDTEEVGNNGVWIVARGVEERVEYGFDVGGGEINEGT